MLQICCGGCGIITVYYILRVNTGMKTTSENNTLTLYLDGRIDTNNASQTESEIFAPVEGKTEGIALSSYLGTTDTKQLELFSQRCAAFAFLRMATTLGFESGRARKVAGNMVSVLRRQLFPNTENFCKLFAMTV